MKETQISVWNTRFAWRYFNVFTNAQLDVLLNLAGIEAKRLNRNQKLNNCLLNWFHGNVPNFAELDRLTNE